MAKTTVLGKILVVPKGEYNIETQYRLLDIITLNGSSYLVKKDCLGIEPPNDEYYMLLADKGDTPVKGVDYYTEEEKQEIIDTVISNININGDGTVSKTCSVYKVQANSEQSDVDALNTVATEPKKGDIGIVTRVINSDKLSYTSYVYNEAWEAMDGNYNAENVYFSDDLIITTDIGVHKIDYTGSKTLNTSGKNVKEVFDLLLKEERNPVIVEPSISISSDELEPQEIGSFITPTYNISFDKGSYEFSKDTGVTPISYTVTDSNDNTLTEQSGSFEQVQITENTNYTINATVEYSQGNIPKTNLGNDYVEGQIQSGSKTVSSESSLIGYRNSFYGTVTNKDNPIDSNLIRSLIKTNKALKEGDTITIDLPIGIKRVIFAYPNTLRDVTSIKDTNALNTEISSAFTKTEIEVKGANDYNGIQYKVYTLDFSSENDIINSYKIII